MAQGNWRRGRGARTGSKNSFSFKNRSPERSFSKPLWLEQLEDRRMLATFAVTNLSDLVFNNANELVVAEGSLREAIIASNGTEEDDLIVFAPNLRGTIQLGRSGDEFGALTITGGVEIVGMGAYTVAINAASNRRVFEIEPEGDDPITVAISGLTIQGGQAFGTDENAGRGGGVLNNGGNLTLTEVIVVGNQANYGGGIFNAAGTLTVQRSLVQNNTANNGGGIMNGVPDDGDGGGTTEGPPPVTRIVSSTITGNEANTGFGYGGGVFNRQGRMDVLQSTIVDNIAYLGSGLASWGNPLPEAAEEGADPPADPEPTIFTTIVGSVLFDNFNYNTEEPSPVDLDVVGLGEPAEEGEDPPPLLPSINIRFDNDAGKIVAGKTGGNNLLYGLGQQVLPSAGDLPAGTNPQFISDDEGVPLLDNYGGSTLTYHPDSTSPLIDHHETVNDLGISGASGLLQSNDQRGFHFARLAKVGQNPGLPFYDIGAVEVQQVTFGINIVADEGDDLQYTGNAGVTSSGDFSFREALIQSELNPLVDTIVFSSSFFDLVDPTPSPAPTFLITLIDSGTGKLAPLRINHSVNIVGPSSFVLEIDGNDSSAVFASGTRAFDITNGNDQSAVDVLISNLTIIRGDVAGSGGAILNRENLTLDSVTLRNNRASLNGGGIHHDRGTLDVLNSTLSGNNTSNRGAIYVSQNSGAVTISNTTISGNTAQSGGGVFNRGNDTRIEFSTITNNNAGSTIGSGVMSWSGTLTFYSSIISANFLNDVAVNSPTSPTTTSAGYNLVGTVNAAASGVFSPGIDIFSTTPGLAPLAFAGGLTQTHALLPNSPAINAGDTNPVSPPEFDQRGNPFERIFDGKEDAVTELRMDIGAYELQGRVYRVDNDGDDSDGNYTAGQLTLREAVELANLGSLKDFIEFDTTVEAFTGNAQISPSDSLPITDNVAILWNGAGQLTLGGSGTVFTITNGNAATFIDVSISGGDRGVSEIIFAGRNIINLENLLLETIDMLGNTTSAVTHQLGALEVIDCTLTGNISTVSGGAINAQNAKSVSISYSYFTGNSTAFTGGHGGAIYLKNSPFSGKGVVLANNLTAAGASDGAGIYVDNSGITSGTPEANDVRFESSVISGNTTIGANSDGAGIFAKNADVYLENFTTVALNSTFGTNSKGGAIYLNGGGSLTITDNVTFTFNRTLGQFSSGGAIASVGGTVTIIETDISNNTTVGADAHGGAIYIQDGALSVIDSAFYENSTTGLRSDGGAIFSNTNLSGKQTSILSSTISGNSTNDRGGGLYNADGLTVIKHSTITNNSAPYFGFGSGVGTFGNSTTTKTQVGHSIIAGNIVNDPMLDGNGQPTNFPSDVDRINGNFQDSFQSLGYNLIGKGITTAFTTQNHDFFNIADPGLEKLANNGGPTLNHALKEGSLAINGGNPSALAGQNGVPEFDQRGKDRVYNQGAGGRIDIGAFESSLSPSVSGDFNNDGVINGRDFLAWQRGQSPTPGSSGDLADWQSNYGAGGGTLVAALVVEEFSESVSAPLVADETASEPSFASSEPILTGWILQAPVSSNPSSTFTEAEVDVAYLAAGSELDDYILAAADDDFGDIVTSRSLDDDSDELSAEDAVFELIGVGDL